MPLHYITNVVSRRLVKERKRKAVKKCLYEVDTFCWPTMPHTSDLKSKKIRRDEKKKIILERKVSIKIVVPVGRFTRHVLKNANGGDVLGV